ncbi:zinc finger and SCAN domain-containing protein 2 isoform X4 [Salmo salar]|uniref:Zinc finger and SCAN domain-containing protein 2 isoform X4 n=1 Tax=Salmo salar TaxID=8030 RepID=A0ABM3D1R0_SALSA|nr:zinc finger and SCAN domain-containing protein 2-like isoform X4 [Salmo salar]
MSTLKMKMRRRLGKLFLMLHCGSGGTGSSRQARTILQNKETPELCSQEPLCRFLFINTDFVQTYIHSLGPDCDSGAQFALQDPEMASVKLEDCSQTLELNVIIKDEEEEKIGASVSHGNHVDTFSTSREQQQEDHRAKRSHHCPHCEEIFQFLSKLKIHTGENLYSCTDCGKNFSLLSNFKRHERIHTGEKPYLCSDCVKCFTTSTELKRHQRTHTGEKPYSCSDCGKSFSQLSNLKAHVRIHTGENP